jgi:hypothetical protein
LLQLHGDCGFRTAQGGRDLIFIELVKWKAAEMW